MPSSLKQSAMPENDARSVCTATDRTMQLGPWTIQVYGSMVRTLETSPCGEQT